jgi:hypothetical protein
MGAMTTPTGSTADAQLRDYRPPTRVWECWQRCEPALRGTDFNEVRTTLLDPDCPHERKDEILRALICRAQISSGEHGALTIAVCLLPGLKGIASRYRGALERQDLWADLTAAPLARLQRYDPRRHPRLVAWNLLPDSAKQVARSVRREREWRQRVTLDDQAARSEQRDNDVDDSGLDIAAKIGAITSFEAILIRATRLDGVRLADFALLMGISYEAAKKRRQRAEIAWRSWWIAGR